jgi:hypothetical protein
MLMTDKGDTEHSHRHPPFSSLFLYWFWTGSFKMNEEALELIYLSIHCLEWNSRNLQNS